MRPRLYSVPASLIDSVRESINDYLRGFLLTYQPHPTDAPDDPVFMGIACLRLELLDQWDGHGLAIHRGASAWLFLEILATEYTDGV